MPRWRDVPPYAWLWLVVALQVAIPASYYLRDGDPDDERFAWRMFSNVRFRRCDVSASLVREDGQVRALALRGRLHSAWVHNLERGRGRVIERFLSTHCEAGVSEALLERRCRGLAEGAPFVEYYRFDCTRETLTLRPQAEGATWP